MNYLSQMEDGFGDENECYGHCGLCNDCDARFDQNCDDFYDDEEAA